MWRFKATDHEVSGIYIYCFSPFLLIILPSINYFSFYWQFLGNSWTETWSWHTSIQLGLFTNSTNMTKLSWRDFSIKADRGRLPYQCIKYSQYELLISFEFPLSSNCFRPCDFLFLFPLCICFFISFDFRIFSLYARLPVNSATE